MNVCFVCTGNIFRSMSAEYCLRDYLEKKGEKGINVSSAGTVAHIETIAPKVLEELSNYGINPSNHKQRKLTQNIIDENDLVVAMSTDHKEFIKNEYGKDVFLYKKICYNKNEPLFDIGEEIKNWFEEDDLVEAYEESVVDFIYESIPLFYKNMNKFLK